MNIRALINPGAFRQTEEAFPPDTSGEKAFFIYRKSPDFIYETPGGVGTIIYFEKFGIFYKKSLALRAQMRYYMYVARPGSCVLVRVNEITSVMPLREVAGYAIRVISAGRPRYGQRAYVPG